MAKPVLGSDPLARLKSRSPELLPDPDPASPEEDAAPAESSAAPEMSPGAEAPAVAPSAADPVQDRETAAPAPTIPGASARTTARAKAPGAARARKEGGRAGETTEARIRAFEHRLEKRLQRFDTEIAHETEAAPGIDPTVERRLVEALARAEERIGKLTTLVDELEEEERQGVLESIIELGDAVQRAFSFDTYRRTFNNLGMRNRRFDVDEFGLESDARESILPFVRFLFDRWWRVKVAGIENVPLEGSGLIVGNHSGVLPWDGVMIAHAIEQLHPAQRRARFLAEDWVATLPFASAMIRRLGGVRACRENAERLLLRGDLVAVFPEGVKGVGKYFHQRYRLQRFGRGGFVQIALRTGAPMIPVAVIGAEETHPVLYKSNWLANALRAPFFPVSPTWPLLGPLGLVPLPSKWQLRFGEPIRADAYRPEDADNEFLVNQLKEKVRTTIQAMVDEALAERRSIWFG